MALGLGFAISAQTVSLRLRKKYPSGTPVIGQSSLTRPHPKMLEVPHVPAEPVMHSIYKPGDGVGSLDLIAIESRNGEGQANLLGPKIVQPVCH